jgi:hypothetical protein
MSKNCFQLVHRYISKIIGSLFYINQRQISFGCNKKINVGIFYLNQF